MSTAVTTTDQSMNFYELSAELAQIEADLAATGGVIESEEQEQRYLEVINAHLSKAENLIALIKRSEHLQAITKAEADRIAARSRAHGNMAQRWKDLIKQGMKMAGRTKIETSRGMLSINAAGGKPPLVMKDGVSAATVPECYAQTEIVRTINKEAIRADLESGDPERVERASQFAYLAERGDFLRIY